MAWTTSKDATVDGAGYSAFRYTTNVTAAEVVLPAVSGKTTYITHLKIHSLAATVVTIGENMVGGNITTPWVSWEFTTTGNGLDLTFNPPVKFTSGKDLAAKGTGLLKKATITCEGYYA